jgi:hypothetical protein
MNEGSVLKVAVEDLRRQVVGRVTVSKMQRLLGYWVLVQAYGSWQAVEKDAGLSENTLYKQRREFLETFGRHAEDIRLIMPAGSFVERGEARVVDMRPARRG